MTILQINVVANSASTGRIAEEIGKMLINRGHKSYIAYGRTFNESASKLLKIGNNWDNLSHYVYTFRTDKHGFGSVMATKNFIKTVSHLQFDVVALHNIHGYYINVPILFEWLCSLNVPVVWTLHDCWAFTGHCTYFDDIGCEKWMTHCSACPKSKNYPKSISDNSFMNFKEKRRIFKSLKKLELVVYSNWLSGLTKNSFLGSYKVHVTRSALDLSKFKPTTSSFRRSFNLNSKFVILGCASIWDDRKGLLDFQKLYSRLSFERYQIVLVGLKKSQIKKNSKGIIGITRTESIEELVQWYSTADVFINPTTQDNFPTTNIEALACGTPVITYDTGGSPEAIDEDTGLVVPKNDIDGLVKAIETLQLKDSSELSKKCRQRAELLYNKETRYLDYLEIFKNAVNK